VTDGAQTRDRLSATIRTHRLAGVRQCLGIRLSKPYSRIVGPSTFANLRVDCRQNRRQRGLETIILCLARGAIGGASAPIVDTSSSIARRRFESTKRTDLRFHALLTEDGLQSMEWTRVQKRKRCNSWSLAI
jgi:hypothetical protein